jgi:hypothetical protein
LVSAYVLILNPPRVADTAVPVALALYGVNVIKRFVPTLLRLEPNVNPASL